MLLLACLAVSLHSAQPVSAEASRPAFGGNFSPRFVKPPDQSTGKRITIQIAPEQATSDVAASGKTTPSEPTSGWFWSVISPDLAAADKSRFVGAVAHAGSAPVSQSKAVPGLSLLTRISQGYGREILQASLQADLSPALILSIIAVESRGNPDAESKKGALGLMQLMPETARTHGVTDLTDPQQSITAGAFIFRDLLDDHGDDPLLALAAYNAGPGAVATHDGVPPFPETRAYIPRVLGAWRVARTLCLTTPVLFRDGCVFRDMH